MPLTDKEKEEVLNLTFSLVQSAKGGIGFYQLRNDYTSATGDKFPFRELGFTSLQDYILSRPDKFSVVKDSLGSELVNVEVSEKSKHIVKFVTLQRPTLSGKPSAFSASKFYNDQRNREPSRIFRLPDDPLDNYVHPSERLAARHSPSRVKPPRRLTVHAKAEEPVKRPQSPTGKNLIPHRDKDNTPPRRSRRSSRTPPKAYNSMKTPRKPRRVPNKLLIKKPNCLNLNASDDGLVDISTPKNFTRSSAKLLSEILYGSKEESDELKVPHSQPIKSPTKVSKKKGYSETSNADLVKPSPASRKTQTSIKAMENDVDVKYPEIKDLKLKCRKAQITLPTYIVTAAPEGFKCTVKVNFKPHEALGFYESELAAKQAAALMAIDYMNHPERAVQYPVDKDNPFGIALRISKLFDGDKSKGYFDTFIQPLYSETFHLTLPDDWLQKIKNSPLLRFEWVKGLVSKCIIYLVLSL